MCTFDLIRFYIRLWFSLDGTEKVVKWCFFPKNSITVYLSQGQHSLSIKRIFDSHRIAEMCLSETRNNANWKTFQWEFESEIECRQAARLFLSHWHLDEEDSFCNLNYLNFLFCSFPLFAFGKLLCFRFKSSVFCSFGWLADKFALHY